MLTLRFEAWFPKYYVFVETYVTSASTNIILLINIVVLAIVINSTNIINAKKFGN